MNKVINSPHTAIGVASEIIRYANYLDKKIYFLPLVHLTYLCHGWSLGYLGTPLVDEHPEVWAIGIVFPDVYREWRHCGTQGIPFARDYRQTLTVEQLMVVRGCLAAYGSKSSHQLSAMVRCSSPYKWGWEIGGASAKIPHGVLREYFEVKVDEARSRIG